jgi:hypothetical protein
MGPLGYKRKAMKKGSADERERSPDARGLIDERSNLSELQDREPTKRKRIDPWDEKEWWIMIAGYYHQVMGAPAKKHWYEKDGMIKHISHVFKLPEWANEREKHVLDYLLLYEVRGQVYKGERLKGQGAKPLINSHCEYQIIVDVIEKGKGKQMALLLLNEYREIKQLGTCGDDCCASNDQEITLCNQKITEKKAGQQRSKLPLDKGTPRMGDTAHDETGKT